MRINEIITGRIIRYLWICIFGLLTLLLLAEIIASLSWRMQHDTPLLHYIAFLIDKHGYTPYKDVFSTSMIGTFLFHLAIGKIFGYGDFAFRFVDVIYLLLLLGITWFLMRPLGKMVAFAGLLIFGLWYIGQGPKMGLQRDYVGILPIATATLLATKNIGSTRPYFKAFSIGGLFAFSVSIKPHLAIGLPAIIIFMSSDDSSSEHKTAVSFISHFLKYR